MVFERTPKRCKTYGIDPLATLPTTTKLLKREVSNKENFSKQSLPERFLRFRFQSQIYCFAHESSKERSSCFGIKSCEIVDLIVAERVLLVLTHGGLCTAFHQETKSFLCQLNISYNERIRSIFYNKAKESIITVSKPESGTAILTFETLRWPGFVEFDDVNDIILTYSPIDQYALQVWDLGNYQLLYKILDNDILEVKPSPEVLLVVYRPKQGITSVNILAAKNGKVLQIVDYKSNQPLVFIEQVNEHLLVQPRGSCLHLVNVHTLHRTELHGTERKEFLVLDRKRLILTFDANSAVACNFHGQTVARFEGGTLCWQEQATCKELVSITPQQDLLISYLKEEESFDGEYSGFITVSETSTGAVIATIRVNEQVEKRSPLNNVKVVHYCEHMNEIYTGDKDGFICIYGN